MCEHARRQEDGENQQMQVKTVVRSSFIKKILRLGKLLSLLNPSLHCLLNLEERAVGSCKATV